MRDDLIAKGMRNMVVPIYKTDLKITIESLPSRTMNKCVSTGDRK